MGVQIFQVDGFTEKPFSGNPAVVRILPGPCSPTWMQNVAKEMNLSEMVFPYKEENGFPLRWFTPVAEAEVDLCGWANYQIYLFSHSPSSCISPYAPYFVCPLFFVPPRTTRPIIS